jgi:hypothetical protein
MVSKAIVALLVVAGLAVGGVIGFIVGVATSEAGRELLTSMNMVEEKADVGRPKTVSQAGFEFQHPGNWEMDMTNADHDLGHYFYLSSPGGSFIEVTYEENDVAMADGPDGVATNLESKLEQYESYINAAEHTDFKTYGSLTGEGRTLKGREFGNKVSVRVFSCARGESTLVIAEYVYEMDRKLLQPGLDLIERTFVMK